MLYETYLHNVSFTRVNKRIKPNKTLQVFNTTRVELTIFIYDFISNFKILLN